MGKEESKTKREGAGWKEWEGKRTREEKKLVEKAGVQNYFEREERATDG